MISPRVTFFNLALSGPLPELAVALEKGAPDPVLVASALASVASTGSSSKEGARIALLCAHTAAARVFDEVASIRVMSTELHQWEGLDALAPHVGRAQWEKVWATCTAKFGDEGAQARLPQTHTRLVALRLAEELATDMPASAAPRAVARM